RRTAVLWPWTGSRRSASGSARCRSWSSPPIPPPSASPTASAWTGPSASLSTLRRSSRRSRGCWLPEGRPRRLLHPEDAVADVLDRGVLRRGKPESEHRARVQRIDDAVVPKSRGRVVGRSLSLVALARRAFELLALGVPWEVAHHREHRRSLLAPHHADAGVGPHPELPG